MAKANIKTASGAVIIVEGSPSEVSEILDDFRERDERRKHRLEFHEKLRERWKREREERNKKQHTASTEKGKVSVTSVLNKFIKEGFFDEAKKFRQVGNRLEKEGLFIPSSTVHPILSRLVAHGKLMRKKGEDDLWEYVKHG